MMPPKRRKTVTNEKRRKKFTVGIPQWGVNMGRDLAGMSMWNILVGDSQKEKLDWAWTTVVSAIDEDEAFELAKQKLQELIDNPPEENTSQQEETSKEAA